MKLDQVGRAHQLCSDRVYYMLIIENMKLDVRVCGKEVDEDMLALVRPVVLGEYVARIKMIERQLIDLGVEIDERY